MKTVIFDMDGTILDTLEDLYLSVNAVLEKMGHPLRTREEVRRFVGNGIPKLMERSLPEGAKDQKEEMLAVFTPYYEEHCLDNTRPYDGVLEVMEELKKQGFKIGVASNKADDAVQILCKSFFPGLVDVAVGDRADLNRKPAPDFAELIIKSLGTTKENTLYVGDSDVDIETARNSCLKDIIVTWGFRDRELLEERGATTIVETTGELLTCLLDQKD